MASDAGSCICFGPFRLETTNARLLREGHEIEIAPKAFDLLRYLAERPDRLVTKAELLAALWPDVIVSDASVKVCVREVRAALNDDARCPTYIHTIHRRGYRFTASVPDSSLTTTPAPHPSTEANALQEAASAPASAEVAVLAGREPQLQVLTECLMRAAAGERQVVLVSGESGSGKSAFVEAFVRRLGSALARTQKPRVLRGHCFDQLGTNDPYMPIWEALSGTDHRLGPANLASHGLAASSAEPTAKEGGKHGLLRELVELLEAMSAKTPVLLILEDVHWADSCTLDLLSVLARRRSKTCLMILATCQPLDSFGTHPRVVDLAVQLKTRGQCREVALHPLDLPGTQQYLTSRFNAADLSAPFVERIHHLTGGSPLLLTQFADALIERGLMVWRDSRWMLATPDTTASHSAAVELLDALLPQSVIALIEARLLRLSLRQRQVLEAAAVAGNDFSAAAVAGALSASVVWAERVCEDLVRRHRLLESAGSAEWPDGTVATRYRFRFPLYRDAIYRAIPIARRVLLHSQLGLRLEAAWATSPFKHASELARHFQAAGDGPRAARYQRLIDTIAKPSAEHRTTDAMHQAAELLARMPMNNHTRLDHPRTSSTVSPKHLAEVLADTAPAHDLEDPAPVADDQSSSSIPSID